MHEFLFTQLQLRLFYQKLSHVDYYEDSCQSKQFVDEGG